MSGYRDEPEIFGDEPQKAAINWKRWFIALCSGVAYAIPLEILWTKCRYPDSLGVQITDHGKAGMLEKWWYSYLLIQRHRPLDVATFAYMWLPIAGLIGWFAIPRLKRANFSLYSNSVE
jgi:hypothetical protein